MPSSQSPIDDSLANHLQKTLEEWNKYRQAWETRWSKSWRRLNNIYEKEFSGSEGAGWRSKHYYGVTRQKCRVALSLLYELVFQRGRVPYDLANTPISDSEDAAVSQAVGERPEDRAKAMLKLLDDQFVEAKLDKKLRMLLRSGIEMGTGVLRGPFPVPRIRNQWIPRLPEGGDKALEQIVAQFAVAMQNAESAGAQDQMQQISSQQEAAVQQFVQENRFYDLARREEMYPDFDVVDLWDVWLDPNSETVEDAVGVFERRVFNPEELAALTEAKNGKGKPIYDAQAIEDILTGNSAKGSVAYRYADMDLSLSRGPHRERLTYENYQREITTVTFTGSLPAHILDQYSRQSKGVDYGGEKSLKDFKAVECIVEFCRGRVIRFERNAYPRQRRLYYIWRYAREAGSPYGWGLSDELEHSQSCFNGFLRLFLDNKRLAASVGKVIREGKVLNAGDTMKPGWTMVVDENTAPRDAVMFQTIPDVSGNCLEALKFCEDWANVASGLPAFLEGDQVGHKANTAYEASELKTSAMKQLGVPIQAMDDDVIVPLVEAVYDWNMQFSENEAVKGDFTIQATGFATFKNKTLVGIELRNLLNLYLQAPQLFPAIDADAILRELERIGELPAGKFVLPEDKAAEKAAQQQESQAQAAAQAAQAAAQEQQAKTEGRIQEIQAKGQVDAAADERQRKHDLAMKMIERAAQKQDAEDERTAPLPFRGA